MGYPRVTTGTETTHMVTRTNIFMIKEVTHMGITPITIKMTITHTEIVEVFHETLITIKMTITHIEIVEVVHETAKIISKITHMERSGAIWVNQIF